MLQNLTRPYNRVLKLPDFVLPPGYFAQLLVGFSTLLARALVSYRCTAFFSLYCRQYSTSTGNVLGQLKEPQEDQTFASRLLPPSVLAPRVTLSFFIWPLNLNLLPRVVRDDVVTLHGQTSLNFCATLHGQTSLNFCATHHGVVTIRQICSDLWIYDASFQT